jgi:hypothetical protein
LPTGRQAGKLLNPYPDAKTRKLATEKDFLILSCRYLRVTHTLLFVTPLQTTPVINRFIIFIRSAVLFFKK